MSTPDASRATFIVHELSECRQRGIERLDRNTHNQTPITAPELQRLAAGYAAARRTELRGRIAQIKALLRDALAVFERSDPDHARLIEMLFFGSDAGMVRKAPTELLRDARHAYGNPSDSWFREMRTTGFRRFAEFLIDFAEAAGAVSRRDSPPPGLQAVTAEAPARVHADRRLVLPRLEAVLRFSYMDPGNPPTPRAVTIEEHQGVIRERGRCWWGWYKANHDEDHTSAMAERLRNCEVGLWERAESLFYVAQCDNVVVGDGTRILSPDQDLTPSYYREQPYPAWLSLRSIRESSRQEFVERFGELPTTPATVHWTPQPAPEPLVVQAEGQSVLHLADLRFGNDHRWATAGAPRRNFITTEQAIARALLVNDVGLGAVGVVVICGNFVSGSPTEDAYREALAFIDGLCEQLPNVGREDVVIVPGSDDFARPGNRERSEQALYREFHHTLYGADGTDLTRMRRYEFAGFRLNVLPVNSVKMLGVDELDDGLFGHGQDALLARMHDDYLRIHEHHRVINVVAAHHHLISTLVQLAGDPQIPIQARVLPGIHDAGGVLDKLSANRVVLFLHGHLHEARYRIITSDEGWQTAVCGAGTAGASESSLRQKYREGRASSLALYDIGRDRIRGRMIAYDETFRRDPAPRNFDIKI